MSDLVQNRPQYPKEREERRRRRWPAPDPEGLLEEVDVARSAAFDAIPKEQRAALGQFGTPTPVARLMASMFEVECQKVRLLDAGAGVGSLTTAFVEKVCAAEVQPRTIEVAAFEMESRLIPSLHRTLERCASHCDDHGIRFEFLVFEEDFIAHTVANSGSLLERMRPSFNFAIQNPPYKKIRSDSQYRQQLRSIGIEVSNLYAAFVALTTRVLEENGQLVAITPRSFCNGPYFKHFRSDFLRRMALDRIHVFDSRSEAFGTDGVLQENVIVSARASRRSPSTVTITASSGMPGDAETTWSSDYSRVAPEGDQTPFIYLLEDRNSEQIADAVHHLPCGLSEIGAEVSTGRVVDFRAKRWLRKEATKDSVPLIYPMHLKGGSVSWPVVGAKKPNGIVEDVGTASLLVPPGTYALVKRFSSKEQRRRIEASLFDSKEVKPSSSVGFENHLNFFHSCGVGLDRDLALGLVLYLNSSIVDLYFRLFSGHTQVNATDLRALRYPTRDVLRRMGARAGTPTLTQQEVDRLVREEVFTMAKKSKKKAGKKAGPSDPVASIEKVKEAREVLRQLELPKQQTNDRSALVLLALLNLQSTSAWKTATDPLLGITEMMGVFERDYGKKYAPNSRETVRRQTVHQFMEAGLVVRNPDDPNRPVNSGKNRYQISPEALSALRCVGTKKWDTERKKYLKKAGKLAEKYAQKRNQKRIPVEVAKGKTIELSPGGQNVLVKEILGEFLQRFAPGAKLLYVGDTEDKWAYFDKEEFAKLGLDFDPHGKFPDVVALMPKKNWLLLIEAVTSHGPVDAKRHGELKDLFGSSKAGLVFVTTFLRKRDMAKYLDVIAWETEVWVAESPGHMVHFNGKRFLGPYGEDV